MPLTQRRRGSARAGSVGGLAALATTLRVEIDRPQRAHGLSAAALTRAVTLVRIARQQR
jgi:hypothetical protein